MCLKLQFLLVVKVFKLSLVCVMFRWLAGQGVRTAVGGDELEIQQEVEAKGKGHTWGH